MKSKMILIIVVVILLFAGLMVANSVKNKQALKDSDNPYGKDQLKQETIDQLNDPLYQNIIIPEDLDAMLENEETVTVFYYSPTCVYCQKATPVVVPITEELNIDMKKMNLLEFDKMDYYDIEGTPTIVHYENGEEVGRVEGLPENPEEAYRAFFETNVN